MSDYLPAVPPVQDQRPNGSDANGQPTAKTLAEIALEISEEYPVFLCRADKSPLTPRGFKDATQDPQAITRLFSHPEAALIGVPTGDVTKIVVIDTHCAKRFSRDDSEQRGLRSRSTRSSRCSGREACHREFDRRGLSDDRLRPYAALDSKRDREESSPLPRRG